MSDAAKWDRERAELVEKYDGEIARLTTREQKLLKVIERHLEAEAGRAITAADGYATSRQR